MEAVYIIERKVSQSFRIHCIFGGYRRRRRQVLAEKPTFRLIFDTLPKDTQHTAAKAGRLDYSIVLRY